MCERRAALEDTVKVISTVRTAVSAELFSSKSFTGKVLPFLLGILVCG